MQKINLSGSTWQGRIIFCQVPSAEYFLMLPKLNVLLKRPKCQETLLSHKKRIQRKNHNRQVSGKQRATMRCGMFVGGNAEKLDTCIPLQYLDLRCRVEPQHWKTSHKRECYLLACSGFLFLCCVGTESAIYKSKGLFSLFLRIKRDRPVSSSKNEEIRSEHQGSESQSWLNFPCNVHPAAVFNRGQ